MKSNCAFSRGCVYIQILHWPGSPAASCSPEQFKVAYGGYTFTMDTANEKTTRDAWEAFTQSQAYRCPRANAPCFRPDEQPGALIHRGGQVFVNTYWPVDVPRSWGRAPFLDHLSGTPGRTRPPDSALLHGRMRATQGRKSPMGTLVGGK